MEVPGRAESEDRAEQQGSAILALHTSLSMLILDLLFLSLHHTHGLQGLQYFCALLLTGSKHKAIAKSAGGGGDVIIESSRETRRRISISSHVSCKPGQCAPLRREGPRQLVVAEAPGRTWRVEQSQWSAAPHITAAM